MTMHAVTCRLTDEYEISSVPPTLDLPTYTGRKLNWLEIRHCHSYVQRRKQLERCVYTLDTKHYNTSCSRLAFLPFIVDDVQTTSLYVQ